MLLRPPRKMPRNAPWTSRVCRHNKEHSIGRWPKCGKFVIRSVTHQHCNPLELTRQEIRVTHARSKAFRGPEHDDRVTGRGKRTTSRGYGWKELPNFLLSGYINFLGSTPWIKDESNFYNILFFSFRHAEFHFLLTKGYKRKEKSDSHVSLSQSAPNRFSPPQSGSLACLVMHSNWTCSAVLKDWTILGAKLKGMWKEASLGLF
jgi:hypothetical protein